jgi:hypothetical protein
MAINFTKPSNGYLFDLTGEAGAGTLRPLFRFRSLGTISIIDVYNNRVAYKDLQGTDYNFSFDGSGGYPQLLINGVASDSNLDLFNDLLALL